MIKVGFRHCVSKNLPTSLSINLIVVLGFEHSTLCFLHCSSKKISASFDSRSLGRGTPNYFSKPSIIEILFQGGLKSMSRTC